MAKSKRTMSASHKAAIAAGRTEGAIVRKYLDTLNIKGKPGRPVDPQRAKAKLTTIEGQLKAETDPLRRLDLEQERIDLAAKVALHEDSTDTSGLENEFVKVAKSYAARKGYSYQAFRQVGVPAAVLRKAGLSRAQSG